MCICGQKGDVKRVKLIKECDGDIEACDYDLRTVAHLAAAEGQWELLKYIAMHTKFNFKLVDRWGKTPIDELANHKQRNELEESIKLRHTHH